MDFGMCGASFHLSIEVDSGSSLLFAADQAISRTAGILQSLSEAVCHIK